MRDPDMRQCGAPVLKRCQIGMMVLERDVPRMVGLWRLLILLRTSPAVLTGPLRWPVGCRTARFLGRASQIPAGLLVGCLPVFFFFCDGPSAWLGPRRPGYR